MNPAGRVLHFVQLVLKKNRSITRPSMEVWNTLFFPSDSADKPPNATAIARSLGQLDFQIERVIQLIRAKNPPPALYAPLDQLRERISPMHMKTPWSQVVQGISGTTVHCLEWSAFILESTEEPVDQEEIDKLIFQLDELESSVHSIDLPLDLRAFITEQLAGIRLAASQYHIAGIEPLKRAFESFVGAAHVRKDELKTSSGGLNGDGIALFKKVGQTTKFVEELVNKGARAIRNAQTIRNTADQVLTELNWNGSPTDGA